MQIYPMRFWVSESARPSKFHLGRWAACLHAGSSDGLVKIPPRCFYRCLETNPPLEASPFSPPHQLCLKTRQMLEAVEQRAPRGRVKAEPMSADRSPCLQTDRQQACLVQGTQAQCVSSAR